MVMKANNCSAWQIALKLRRAPSAITRELSRFATCPDRPTVVSCRSFRREARAAGQRSRPQRFKCRKCSKLGTDALRFSVVQHFLVQAWSCSQSADTLPDIHVSPPEASGGAFPRHWDGYLIKGRGKRSAVGVLVERSSRLVMLIKLTDATAASALGGFTSKLRSIAEPMCQSLTYDLGAEMARHAKLTANTGVMVYFFDLHSLRPRGSCENTDALIPEYLPKITDLSAHSQDQLDSIPICLATAQARSTASTRLWLFARRCCTSSINPVPQFNIPVLHLALVSAPPSCGRVWVR